MVKQTGGVYLTKLRYEVPYAQTSLIGNRYVAQDRMIAETSQSQDVISTVKQDAARAESTVWARYGVAYKNWVDFVTGFPEYLR